MFKSRVLLIKVRYFILLLLLCLVIWQICSKYPIYESHWGNTNKNLESVLKNIKEQVNKSRVLVSVYYEALCPDSRSFFLRHLLPTYLKMQNGVEVRLIPYGKARTVEGEDGKFSFECQHGNIECFANKIHSCAIHNIDDSSLLMKFVTCLIDDFEDPENAGSQCADKYQIQWKLILNCAKSEQGEWLLKKHGELTKQLNPSISFVPTILLNQNHHKQSLILKNLEKELCSNYAKILIKECKN